MLRQTSSPNLSSSRISPVGVWLVLALLLPLLVACSSGAAGPADVAPSPGGAVPAAGVPAAAVTEEEEAEPGGGESEIGVQDSALIVRTGRLRLEVTDIAPVVNEASALVAGLGGYVSASQEENSASQHIATITYRVPSDRWSEALAGLRGLAGRVVSENTESVEVTAEVVDLDARIANLRSAEAALQEIMNRAGTIDDVLKVQGQLAEVRGEIEQLTARRDHLSQQAALATLVVSFETPVVGVTAAQEGWELGTEVDRAVAQLVRIGQAAASFGVWLVIVALPLLAPIALVLLVLLRFRRRADLRAGTPAGPVGPSV
ncbi:MAG TPA: DUF4349 domain-containing protein [Candidatus Caenarcaniphilales bacterium]|nr:DUF4349 domain-containing protein [Candidatus Caenarcaniphilales bacterium]